MVIDLNELFVITFVEVGGASKAWQSLEDMRSDFYTFTPQSSRLVERDKNGELVVRKHKLHLDTHDLSQSIVINLFINAVCNDTDENIQLFVDAGLDEVFLRDVSIALKPDRSALVIYIPHDSVVDTLNLLKSLKKVGGTLYHTIFPSKVEAAILALDPADDLKIDIGSNEQADVI